MPKRFRTAGYVFVFLTLCGFLGWKAIVASGPLPNTAEYQKYLEVTAANIPTPMDSHGPDDLLRVYAVNVAHTAPFEKPFIGDGIYLGHGAVITAAHVVGHWPFFTNPRVFIAGQDLPAKVIKLGSLNQIDLALLSVDQARLPVSLRLRRNPLCKKPLQVGTNVVVVYPERTVRSRIISPLLLAPQLRQRFYSLINDAQGSGSGVFDAEQKCLLGIISRKIMKFSYRKERGLILAKENGYAGYFVPVSKIAGFLPPDFRF